MLAIFADPRLDAIVYPHQKILLLPRPEFRANHPDPNASGPSLRLQNRSVASPADRGRLPERSSLRDGRRRTQRDLGRWAKPTPRTTGSYASPSALGWRNGAG